MGVLADGMHLMHNRAIACGPFPMTTTSCPCGSGLAFDHCCGPLLAGARRAPTAEALMRSRYTAFALGNAAYLLETWHPKTRPEALELDDTPPLKWIGLQVRRHQITGEDRAEVEFVARCRIGGRAERLHESSRFVREDGRWFYVDGELAP